MAWPAMPGPEVALLTGMLHKLDESRTVTEALDRARGEQVVCVLGQREKGPDGRMQMILPRDAGYDITEVPDPSDPSGKRNVVQR